MTVFIYALIDPFTDEVRYIGKTIRPHERYVNQMNEKSNTHRCHWIQSLIAKGTKPKQLILEAMPDSCDWKPIERRWIKEAKRIGWNLTNGTSGGDGVQDLSPEVKAKMASTWIGRKHTEESKKKIGQASRGRKHTKAHLEKMSRIMTNREFSEETRKRISESVSKLTDEQVRNIRTEIANGISQYVLADKYNVHQTTISNINRGISYSRIDNKEVE